MSVWYRVTLEIFSPFITRQSGALPFGLDADMCHAPDGVPAIPGSLIKGNLLEVFERLGRRDLIDEWLGEERMLEPGGSEFRKPAKLIFEPFWKLQDPGKTQSLRTRISIDNNTGATGDKMLQISRVLDSEEKQADGTHPLTFSGWIHVQTDGPPPELKSWIEKGLKLIPALGGDRGVGLGRLHSAAVEKQVEAPALIRSKSTRLSDKDKRQIIDKRSLGLRLHPLWPFCFPHHRPAKSNAIVSRDWIPGSAIKAVLAKTIKRRSGNFDKVQNLIDGMRVTHARPVLKDQRERPAAIPLSLASIKNENRVYNLYDLVAKVNPGLIDGKAPAFQPDWKRKVFDLAREYMGSPEPPPRILQVRNAHDLSSRAAKNKQLYTMESILVHQGYDWLANIDFPDCCKEEELEQLLDCFSDLLDQQDCYPLGRTKTPVAMEIDACGFRFKHGEGPLTKGEKLVITLQSPARLLHSEGLDKIFATGDIDALHQAYQQAFDKLAEKNVLELSHYFAQQELRGGNFWYKKYGVKTLKGYRAQVFTCAGSVFVFDVRNGEKAKGAIDKWRRLGLPQLGDAPGREGKESGSKLWKLNPWIRENGYGEIVVNQKLRHPNEMEWKDVQILPGSG